MLRLPALLCIFALIAQPTLANELAPAAVSVCELASNPSLYDGKRVRASGIVESDAYHYTSLMDEECPKTGIAINITNVVSTHKDVAKLQKPIYAARPLGTRALKITATITGTFRKGTGLPAVNPMPRTIDVQSVADLKVRHWDPKEPKPWADYGPPPSE